MRGVKSLWISKITLETEFVRDGISKITLETELHHAKRHKLHVTQETHEVTRKKQEPINLTDNYIDENLVHLCKHGPSFVPTQIRIDWNDIQQSWLACKKKVRWRAIFHLKQSTEREVSGLDAPYQKSKNDPPTASNQLLKYFLIKWKKIYLNKQDIRILKII
jgi:hypothetical protein